MKVDADVAYAVPYFNDDVAATAELVQAGETLLYGAWYHNTTAADAFLLLFDAATADAVTVGTTAPTHVLGAGANLMGTKSFLKPLHFANGVVIASTTATDGADPAAQDVSLEIG